MKTPYVCEPVSADDVDAEPAQAEPASNCSVYASASASIRAQDEGEGELPEMHRTFQGTFKGAFPRAKAGDVHVHPKATLWDFNERRTPNENEALEEVGISQDSCISRISYGQVIAQDS